MNFEDFIYPSQENLFKKIKGMYRKSIAKEGKYILVKGKAPIMLVAHMDTVHRVPVTDICKTEDGNIMMSPQGIGGDDRCGVYALMSVYQKSKVKPWLLFTCDEEIGCVGASDFAADHANGQLPKELDSLKCIVEIDRKGSNDAVYYDCDNIDFEAYITKKGFKTAIGSFTDISEIAPELGVAAVNLSSGYYNAHTEHEFIDLAELEVVIKKVVEIVNDATKDMPKYEYIDAFAGWCTNSNNAFPYEYGNWAKRDFKSLEIEEMYYWLLDWYTEDELNEIIDLNGESGIKWLYETEFGMQQEEKGVS